MRNQSGLVTVKSYEYSANSTDNFASVECPPGHALLTCGLVIKSESGAESVQYFSSQFFLLVIAISPPFSLTIVSPGYRISFSFSSFVLMECSSSFFYCVVSSRAVFVDREHQWDSQVHRLSSDEFHEWSFLRQGPLRLHRYVFLILWQPQSFSYFAFFTSSSLSFVISEVGRSGGEWH